MRRKGRPPAWTPEQREQVLALADEGMAQRAIAELVFGDARYRGRVERILRERVMPPREVRISPRLTEAEVDEAFDAYDMTVARELVVRFERSLAESEEVPALAEVERLLRIKRQIDAAETVARLRRLSREHYGHASNDGREEE